jgi:hypothetical protein
MSRRLLLQSVALALVSLGSTLSLVASARSAFCPNEALRSELRSGKLADCRAYELVTPAAKNGWSLEETTASLTGARMIATSLGSFAGSNQVTLQSVYEFTRSQDGWTTEPVTEPTGLFNPAFQNLLAGTPDLSEGMFRYRPASARNLSEGGFYIRSLPDGVPVEVGPMFSPTVLSRDPPKREEASSEPNPSRGFAHILFMIAGPTSIASGNYLWPGDTTVENTGPLYGSQGFASLYEYTGTGNTAPALVGVENDGRLISQCGTSLGFPQEGKFSKLTSSELYNAISADGSRVFFTAAGARQGVGNACTGAGAGSGPPANELFARVDGSETVAISEPSPGDCPLAACNTAEPADAVFQGASEDGSKAFFLTSQPLLRSDTDTTTDLYEYDFSAPAGHKIIQVSAGGADDATPGLGAQVQGVARVSQDGSHVYFVARGRLTSRPNPVGDVAQVGADNMYLYEHDSQFPEGRTAFIGALSASSDTEDWQQEDRRPVDTTPDGRFLVFTSSARLTRDDTSSVAQVFEYDAQAETLVRASVGQGGFNNDGNTDQYEAGIAHPSYTGSLNPAAQPTSVSDDGMYVVFESHDALTPGAAGRNNVYEYRHGQVNLISDGQDRSPNTFLVGIDASGTNLFFTTAGQLVPQDGDTQRDVYDARIDGGFPPPLELRSCDGEGCRGGLIPEPLSPLVTSATQPAGEDLALPAASHPVTKPAKHKAMRKLSRAKHQRKAAKARGKASSKGRG